MGDQPLISAAAAIGPSMSRTGEVLFRPFRFGKWFVLALPAGLTLVGEGGSSNFNSSSSRSAPAGTRPPTPAEVFGPVLKRISDNFGLFIFLAAVTLLFLVSLWIFTRWLNCRGRFMFFSNLVNNDTAIRAPWKEYGPIAGSLWRLRLLWDLCRWGVSLVIFATALALSWPDLHHFYDTGDYAFTGATGAAILVALPLFVVFAVAVWIANGILMHLAVPVMFVRGMNAWPAIGLAWRDFFRAHIGQSLLYFLLMLLTQIVWVVWFIIALIPLCIVTLCIGGILSLLPIVGCYSSALITLPVLVFKKTFELNFVSQFGGEYRVTWRYVAQGGFPVITDQQSPPDQPMFPA